VTDDDTFRLLRLFNAHPQRNQNWWIVQNLRDPAALPLLRYWGTLPAPENQTQMLQAAIKNLESRSQHGSVPAKTCCGPTEDCLRQQLSSSAAGTGAPDVAIHSEEEARAWLQGKAAPPEDFAIRYSDDLKRTAVVSRKTGAEEHWQYLYDCWRNTDETLKTEAAH
jgi:hypothetical protein